MTWVVILITHMIDEVGVNPYNHTSYKYCLLVDYKWNHYTLKSHFLHLLDK